MIFQFNDKGLTIKHLGFLIETKKLNTQTLRIKESFIQGSIAEDLLFYEKEEGLTKDLKKLKKALEEYTRIVNDMQKQKPIGFGSLAIGEDDEEESEPVEE